MPFRDLLDAPDRRVAHDGRRADRTGVVGIEVDAQACVLRGPDEQRHVVAPVARDDRVCARGLDLRDVRGEVLYLAKRVQVVADDLDVGALAGKVGPGGAGDRLPEGVVLIDEVDALDGRIFGEV